MKLFHYYIVIIIATCLFLAGCEEPKKAPPEKNKPAGVIEGVKNKVDEVQKKTQEYNDLLESMIKNPDTRIPSDDSETPTASSTTSAFSEVPQDDEDETEGPDLDLTTPPPGIITEEEFEAEIEKLIEPLPLGEIIGEDPENLVRLDEKMAIWVDKKKSKVVLQGWICQTQAPLEFFMCTGRGIYRTFIYHEEDGGPEKFMTFLGAKTHESIVCVDVRPNLVHTALLAIGAKSGTHVVFYPKFKPATGDEIEVTLRWKDENGKTVSRRGQEVMKEITTEKALDIPWVFAGSMFYADEDGEQHYAADSEGEIICVSNFPSAILDVPKASIEADRKNPVVDEASGAVHEVHEILFLADEKKLPPRGTPVTILLEVKK